MSNEAINAGLPAPVVEEFAGGLQVIFNKADIEKVGEKLSKNQARILEFMEIDKSISARKLAVKIGISPRKIEENIKVLKEMHRIKRVGSDKGGSWKILS